MRIAMTLLALALSCGAAQAVDQEKELLAQSVPDEELEKERGGETTRINLMSLEARLDDNVARDNITGSNFIAEGAFSNASGLATVIQNSGNNVVIQNATIVNLELK